MSACMAPDARGELRTTHDHFEGRCVVEPLDPDFRERLAAYRTGGWDEWREVASKQRGRGVVPLRDQCGNVIGEATYDVDGSTVVMGAFRFFEGGAWPA